MTSAKEVQFFISENEKLFQKEIKTYSEFPHLKRLDSNSGKVGAAIIARSQLEIITIRKLSAMQKILPKLATQTQLKEISIIGILTNENI